MGSLRVCGKIEPGPRQEALHHSVRMGSKQEVSFQYCWEICPICPTGHDVYEDGYLPGTTQQVIDVNAGMLSFLKINIISSMLLPVPDFLPAVEEV